MDHKPQFREAGVGDLLRIAQFNKDMALETEDLELSEATLQAGVKGVLEEASRGKYYVLQLDKDVVAQLLITYEWSDWRNGQIWWIQSVYVVPQHRRRGYYRMLYERIKELAQQSAAVGLRLYADDGNKRAHATYESMGMTSHYKVFESMFQ